MANEKHDPWALLREARGMLSSYPQDSNEVCTLLGRIDAALAEHDAVPPSEVKWRPIGVFGDVDEYVATIGQVNMTIHAEPVSSTGDLLWEVRHTYAASGTAPTLDEAKSAAIAAARGMR